MKTDCDLCKVVPVLRNSTEGSAQSVQRFAALLLNGLPASTRCLPLFWWLCFLLRCEKLYSFIIVTSCYNIIIAILTYRTLQMNYKE